jgi:hypothetical protein
VYPYPIKAIFKPLKQGQNNQALLQLLLKVNTIMLGKPQMLADANRIIMSEAERLARWHELLKDPLRQKILLKLGEHDKLSFDELLKELKIDDQEELYDQLQVLGDLVTKVKDDQYLLPQKGVSQVFGDQYMLTEEGHDALDELIAYPEIESDNYKEIFDKNGLPKPNFAKSNQRVMVFLSIMIVATVIVFLIAFYFHWKIGRY